VSQNRFCDFLADPDSRSFSRFGAIIMQFAVAAECPLISIDYWFEAFFVYLILNWTFAGEMYRISMYVATSSQRRAQDAVKNWQDSAVAVGASAGDGAVVSNSGKAQWELTIPKGCWQASEKTALFVHFICIFMIILPRQARDKYRKYSKSAVFLQATRIKGVSKHSEEHEVLIVPWSAVKVREKKRDDTTGVTTIFADVLEDATIAPGDLPTIVA
jgi:hypothetical protein